MDAAESLALQMPLTHATSIGALRTYILPTGALLSQIQSGRRAGNAEAIMETADDVFLYAAPFSYPDTECGFLFVSTLEDGYRNDGVATPFDSGALASMMHVRPPSTYSDGVACVRDHELPVSEYREILSIVIAAYSRGPVDYLHCPDECICTCGVSRGHPFGLSGGDRRAWTFEVRIPQRVALEAPQLRAVFVPEGFEIAALSTLFASGVEIVSYTHDSDDSRFEAMRNCCIDFILKHFVV